MTTSFRRAGVLDVPFIFQLLQEGAEAGAFASAFVGRLGSVNLLRFVLKGITKQYFQFGRVRGRFEWLIISTSKAPEVGFIKLHRGLGEGKDMNLELMAIAPEWRNKGVGTSALFKVLAQVPSGGRLQVYCTKYARAMQHILKKNGMKRNVKFHASNLEEYRSVWSDITPT